MRSRCPRPEPGEVRATGTAIGRADLVHVIVVVDTPLCWNRWLLTLTVGRSSGRAQRQRQVEASRSRVWASRFWRCRSTRRSRRSWVFRPLAHRPFPHRHEVDVLLAVQADGGRWDRRISTKSVLIPRTISVAQFGAWAGPPHPSSSRPGRPARWSKPSARLSSSVRARIVAPLLARNVAPPKGVAEGCQRLALSVVPGDAEVGF